MKKRIHSISPLDIVILLKIVAYKDQAWIQTTLADDVYVSQAEISKSLARSRFAGLLDPSKKKVSRLALMDLLQYGIRYVFPERPGALVRGLPTAHSAPPLNKYIRSEEHYVWPSAKGTIQGQAITPLYPSVIQAALNDPTLHELLALVDALRVGKARERNLAVEELKKQIVDGV
jgi:hypothetical protein